MNTIPKLAIPIVAIAALSVVGASAHDSSYRPDPWITTKAKIALYTAEDVSGSRIHVDTVNGRVTLYGKVPSAAEKQKAEELTNKIDGVREVRNLLQVVPESTRKSVKIEDSKIKDRVEEALKADASIQGNDIEVEHVDNGVVLLSGSAQTLTAHLHAIEVASSVEGVRHVASEIKSPDLMSDQEIWRETTDTEEAAAAAKADDKRGFGQKMTDVWITSAAKAILIADGDTPAEDINVDTRNGVVTLFGTVPSEASRKAAEADVKKVAGVKKVDNNLQIVPSSKKKAVEVSDDDAEHAAKTSLQSHSEFEDVSVDVKNGVARLTGHVPTQSDRLMAAVIVRETSGVRSVQNDLTVKAE